MNTQEMMELRTRIAGYSDWRTVDIQDLAERCHVSFVDARDACAVLYLKVHGEYNPDPRACRFCGSLDGFEIGYTRWHYAVWKPGYDWDGSEQTPTGELIAQCGACLHCQEQMPLEQAEQICNGMIKAGAVPPGDLQGDGLASGDHGEAHRRGVE